MFYKCYHLCPLLAYPPSKHHLLARFYVINTGIFNGKEEAMPQGDKSAYTDKQKRKAEHIEESYKEKGVSEKEAEKRAWATVNKQDGGGKKSGSGRGK
jgi:hypothetical protein